MPRLDIVSRVTNIVRKTHRLNVKKFDPDQTNVSDKYMYRHRVNRLVSEWGMLSLARLFMCGSRSFRPPKLHV